MRKPFAILSIFWVIFWIFSPILPFIHTEKTYLYQGESHVLPLNKTEVYATTASLTPLEKKVALYSYKGELSFSGAKDSFTMELPLSQKLSEVNPEDIKIIWKTPTGETILRTFDETSEQDIRPSFFSEPAVFHATRQVSYEILSPVELTNAPKLEAVDIQSYKNTLAINTTEETTYAASGSVSVISRASWGADETLRYQDSSAWKAYYANLEKTKNDPVSASVLEYREHVAAIETYLAANFSESYKSVETVATENGHKLVWPLEKTEKVEKVVIHHTAENNLKDLADEALMRSMYYYHAVSRWWGDIGYNYVIGQRGKIYEWRAGGDYSVGAHASWNNRSTVGVSVMGNFETGNVVQEQEDALKNILEYLSKKYGIDYSKKSYSHKECKGSSANTCLLDDSETYNLIGHRDAGYTACPWKNLYALLDGFRKSATYSFGLAYKVNPKAIQIASSTTSNASWSVSTGSTSKWPNLRVLLSYNDKKSVTIQWLTTVPSLTFKGKTSNLKQNTPIKIDAIGSTLKLTYQNKKYSVGSEITLSSDILRVNSWDRKPTWDTSGTMNDNLFRGSLRIKAVDGKIQLVNILPIEDYLKGLAEISNNDPEEKVKTILVAARGYAYFYNQEKNRKFPGKDYDASDDPDVFQKYLGYGYEKRSPRIASLVSATRGIGITYNGTAIKPWYFSSSDGKTRSYKEYCTTNGGKNCENIPYLLSVEDPAGAGQTRKGHGVGISGVGATYFANIGWTYDQIISYYLTGTKTASIY